MLNRSIMEYHPSLVISEYELGSYCMFVRNINFTAKNLPADILTKELKTSKNDKTGGIEPDITSFGGGIEPDVVQTKGGIEPDDYLANSKEDIKQGGIEPDNTYSEPSLKEYSIKRKKYGNYEYVPGLIIGSNKEKGYIYVRFEVDSKKTCHIFKTAFNSESFDIVDKLIHNA